MTTSIRKKALAISSTALSLFMVFSLLFSFNVSAATPEATSTSTTTQLSLQGERIYQIMTDRFYDGDTTNNATGEAFRTAENIEEDFRYMHGGDWQGIIDKLPYIKGMGFTAIWISPVSDPQLWGMPDSTGKQWPTAYHHYNVYDPNRASRYFGASDPEESKEILKDLVDACHDEGIKVILDVVPNHIGDYLQGTGNNAHYISSSGLKSGTEVQPASPFNNVNWYHNQGDIEWDWEHPHTTASTAMLETHDLGGLDDLDLDTPAAKEAIFDAIKDWFDYTGADAARVDAAKCMKPEDIHDLEEYLNVPTFGENFDMCVDFVAEWVGDDAETGMLDFPLFQATVNNFAYGQNFNDLSGISVTSILNQDYLYGDHVNEMVVFIDNHDRNRFLTEAGGNVQKMQNALTFLFTIRGVPVVFQGTEQNKGNANGEIISGIADTWNRWCMVQKDVNGNVIKDYFDTTTDTYQLIAQLNALKDEYPALKYGTQREMWTSPNFYAFSRRIDSGTDAGEEIICAFSNSNSNQTVTMQIRAESSIAAGTVLENINDPSDRITVSADRKITVSLGSNTNKLYKVSDSPAPETAPVTFVINNATTALGQNVYVAGSSAALGNWNTSLAAGPGVCPDYPTWEVTANLPVGQTVAFKAIKIDGQGNEVWEQVANRNYTVPAGGGTVTFDWDVPGTTEGGGGAADLVPVTFVVNNASTAWGQNVYIAGSIAELGNWAPASAAGPGDCPDYPTWTVTVNLPAGAEVEFKAIKIDSGGSVTWESVANRTFTVPTTGGTVELTWNVAGVSVGSVTPAQQERSPDTPEADAPDEGPPDESTPDDSTIQEEMPDSEADDLTEADGDSSSATEEEVPQAA